jgi:hypothetical protein
VFPNKTGTASGQNFGRDIQGTTVFPDFVWKHCRELYYGSAPIVNFRFPVYTPGEHHVVAGAVKPIMRITGIEERRNLL